MQRILVTGSEGCLGVPLKAELRRRGKQVHGCDLQHSPDAFVVRADIADHRQLERVFSVVRPNLVYALAGEFGRINGQNYPEQLWATNTLGVHNTVEMCLKYDAGLVFASSSEAYGDLADTHRELPESCLEGVMPNHHNQYALSKLVGERIIHIARQQRGLRAISLRFFNVYGPGENYSTYRSVVCLFAWKLLHNEPIIVTRDGFRDFLYIDDWAQTVANIADRFNHLPEMTYNIGDDNGYSIEALANLIFRACGHDPSDYERLIRFRDTEHNNLAAKRPSITLARRDLGHDPRMPLEEGVKRTVAWMRQEYGIVERAKAAVKSAAKSAVALAAHA